MPWKGVTVSEQRQRFLEDYQLNYYSITELAERFSISRKTAYKWINRFEEHGQAAFHEHSRRPHSCLWQTDAVFNSGTVLGEDHPGAGQLPLVAHLGWWDPDRGQLAEIEQGSQSLGIELVGLVDVAHNDLGLGGVGQKGNAAGGLPGLTGQDRRSHRRSSTSFRQSRERQVCLSGTERERPGWRPGRGRPECAGPGFPSYPGLQRVKSVCGRHNRPYNPTEPCCTSCGLTGLRQLQSTGRCSAFN